MHKQLANVHAALKSETLSKSAMAASSALTLPDYPADVVRLACRKCDRSSIGRQR